MTGLGMILLGGEGNIGDPGTGKFLQDVLDQFATLVGRLWPAAEGIAAQRAVMRDPLTRITKDGRCGRRQRA